jgi:hypothetical protein
VPKAAILEARNGSARLSLIVTERPVIARGS